MQGVRTIAGASVALVGASPSAASAAGPVGPHIPTIPAPPTFGGGFTKPMVSVSEVVRSPEAASAFLRDYITREARFFRIARDPVSKLTFDGVMVDPATGAATTLRHWSAPSKESLDIAILLKALGGHPLAVDLVGEGDPGKARSAAVDILRGKLVSYEAFQRKYPGYGGMMPWFFSGRQAEPTQDWLDKVPGLDNGEWAWSLLTAEHELRRHGFTAEADGYRSYVERMRERVVPMFYDERSGNVRGDVQIEDITRADTRYRTILPPTENMPYLSGEHGVHEGQMLVSFMTLFGKGLPDGSAKKIWDGIDFARVEHPHGTTWQAYWGSSHESWAYLFQPFRDMPEYRDLFRIREQIRTHNAVERGYPGLATSTNRPAGTGYLDGAGIEGIGSQTIRNNHTFAIYGAYPLLLEHAERAGGTAAAGNAGLGWLVNMLHGNGQYGPLGGGESATNDGKDVAYMKTIDGSFPNLLAMMGGITAETAEMLRSHGKYEAFTDLFRSEYREAFGAQPLREPSGFALPRTLLESRR